MRDIAKKTITVGFAWVIGLLLTGATVQAQEVASYTVTNTVVRLKGGQVVLRSPAAAAKPLQKLITRSSSSSRHYQTIL